MSGCYVRSVGEGDLQENEKHFEGNKKTATQEEVEEEEVLVEEVHDEVELLELRLNLKSPWTLKDEV